MADIIAPRQHGLIGYVEPMSKFLQHPSNGFVAGVIVAVGIITTLNIADVEIADTSHKEDAIFTTEKAAEDFVDDWDRMRRGTWNSTSTFTRQLNNGNKLVEVISEIQRPPDSLRTSFGVTDVRLNSSHFLCTTDPLTAGKTQCKDHGKVDVNDEVRGEVAVVKSQVVGTEASYDVASRGSSCYDLYLRAQLRPNAYTSFGNKAEVCFDAKTGAISKSQTWKTEGVDIREATLITPDVKSGDIKLPG